MGLFDKAKEAAEHAAERARNAAEQAAVHASGAMDRASDQVRGDAAGPDGQAGPGDALATGRQGGGHSAGDQLRAAAGQARVAAGQLGKATSEAVGNAATAVADPTNQAHARDAASRGFKKAKSGVASVIDRIDPGLLADIVIKATSLQEKANYRLHAKGSPYRINEITITAGLPPDVAFTIGRIDVMEEALTPSSSSTVDDGSDADGETDGAIESIDDLGAEPAQLSAAATDPEVGVAVMAPHDELALENHPSQVA
jgi:hypothetical protein